MIKAISNWIGERLPVRTVSDYLAHKTVPRHKHTFWYLFGGLALFFFSIQIVTGILLALYYKPNPEQANESVRMIMSSVPYGWLIRSIHSWSANLMIGTIFLHMFSVFMMKAYRKPRELMWVTGVALLFISLGFGFTGYLLPWDTVAYFATLIGTEVPKSVPVIGDWGVQILKGGEEVGGETLGRMYTIHTIILPLIALFMIGLHLLLNQVYRTSVPIGARIIDPPIPFFPNFVLRDFISWVVGLAVLLTLATWMPWEIGEKADPLASAPFGIKPEWYFLPLYQSLKMVPATLFSLSGELIVNVLVLLGTFFWVAIPFIDRSSSIEKQSRPFTFLGVIVIAYLVVTIVLAYAT
jgi:cytochrome b6